MYLYREAFGSFNMGYAASMAVVLFVIILAFDRDASAVGRPLGFLPLIIGM